MKQLTLMAAASFLFLFSTAQVSKMVKKWHANTVTATDGTANAADLQKQINLLEITKKTGDQAFTGKVEYGKKPNLISSPCAITTNGKNISITAGDQVWSGIIVETKDETMTYQLGSLTYFFKMVLAPIRSLNRLPKFPIESFYGSWQEISRAYAKNNAAIPINPKDTVYMRMSKDSAMYRPGISSRPMLGYVDISEGDNLNIAQNDFQVKTVSANELVLIENKDILHTLSRINDSFAFERIKEFCPDCKTDPEAGAMAIDLQAASLIHKWSGYKTEANAGFIKPEMAIIRQLDINQSVGPMKYTGKVQFDKSNKRTTQDCTIEFSEDKNSMVTRVSIQTAGEAWNTQVFKADGKQMIMGKKTDGVRYYFRKID